MIIPANTPYISVLKSHKFSCIPHLAYGMNYVHVCFLSEKTWRNMLFSHLSSCFTYLNPTGAIDCCLCLSLFLPSPTEIRKHWCVCVCVCTCTRMPVCLVTQSCPLFVTPWTIAHQALLSMGLSKQEYWSGLPFPSPGDLPDPGF